MSRNNYPWSVYIAWTIIDSKLYAKIGYAANTLHRVQGWAVTGTPAPIHHVIAIRCDEKDIAIDLEKKFHTSLDEYKIIREWFVGKTVFADDLYGLIWNHVSQVGEWWGDELCVEIYDGILAKRFAHDKFYQAMETRVFAPHRTWMLSHMTALSEECIPGWVKYVYGKWSHPGPLPDISVRYQLIPIS